MTRTHVRDWKADAALLFVVLVWGFNFPIIKAVLEVMPPHAMNFFRLVFSALLLGGFYAARQRKRGLAFFAPLRAYTGPVIALGLLGYLVYQVTFIVGINHTAAGSAALIMASVPLWSALLGHLFRFERLRGLAWFGLMLTLSGTAAIVLLGGKEIDFGGAVLFGNLVMLAAAILWGAYTAFNRPVLRHVSPLELTFLGLLVALPFLFVVALPEFEAVEWHRVNGWIWLALLYSGGFSTGLAPVLWSASVQNVGAAHTAAFGNLVPFIALFSSYVLLAEPILPAQILGGLLIIGGIVIMRRARRPVPS